MKLAVSAENTIYIHTRTCTSQQAQATNVQRKMLYRNMYGHIELEEPEENKETVADPANVYSPDICIDRTIKKLGSI